MCSTNKRLVKFLLPYHACTLELENRYDIDVQPMSDMIGLKLVTCAVQNDFDESVLRDFVDDWFNDDAKFCRGE